jgi:hypothetical protein
MVTVRERRIRNAVYQARWRARRAELVRSHPDIAEGELLALAGRCERLSDAERIALADALAERALVHLRRSQELARVARRVRTGER